MSSSRSSQPRSDGPRIQPDCMCLRLVVRRRSYGTANVITASRPGTGSLARYEDEEGPLPNQGAYADSRLADDSRVHGTAAVALRQRSGVHLPQFRVISTRFEVDEDLRCSKAWSVTRRWRRCCSISSSSNRDIRARSPAPSGFPSRWCRGSSIASSTAESS